ncbi:MAG: sulfite exporter TauE/SafE family protein [Eggerthellaceae bacterium]|nr:sulfite exporter TauE/SafE family protein [Eggerthellaceae bacterium]
MDAVVSFILLALVGLVIGIFSGMLGIGGGTIMVPVFRLLFGLGALASTGTSLFAIVPTSISGAYTRIRQKSCIVWLGIAAGLGGACTSPVGVWLSSVSPSWLVMVVAAAVIAYSAVSTFTKALKMKNGEEADEGPDDEQADKGGKLKPGKKQVIIGFLIGFTAGVVSGYIGVGGGFLMIPLMIQILGLSMKDSSGTSLIAMILLAIPGVVEQAFLGNIMYLVGIAVAVGSIPGAIIGAHIVKKIPERTLRFTFSGFLLIAAALLILKEISL